MSCTIEGAAKLRWSVPEWIARNSLFFLIRALESMEDTSSLSERLGAALKQRANFINLSDFFEQPSSQEIWQTALDRADQAIANEKAQDWNVPSAYAPFRSAFNKLRLLAPQEPSL